MTLLPGAPPLSSNDDPFYNIGVVTRMTGISMATLRAWERRYDFPEIKRTSGGHRLYSEKDIMRLRWVKSRIEEGMQTAQAINALRHQELTRHYSEESLLTGESDVTIFQDRVSVISIYQQKLLNTLLQHNLTHADQIISEALVVTNPDQLILNVIGPTLADIGQAWEEEKISIATEHLSTNYLRQRLLMWMVSGPPPYSKPPITLACAPLEYHEGSLLMLGALLRRRRWPVSYLGQSLPLVDLASFIRDMKPSAVVVVAMTETSAVELSNWTQWMPEIEQSGKPPFCFGGRIFETNPEWRFKIPGIYLGETIQEGLEHLERILSQN